MGGKKRSRKDEEYSGILKKIRKLEEKVKKKSRKRQISSSSESEFEVAKNDECSVETQSNDSLEVVDSEHSIENDDNLDQEILKILGDDDITNEKTFGENLHKDLALRWKNILLNGLSKENRSILLKEYLPSENCNNMKAPKLNPEIRAAITEINYKKDLYSQNKQNQLASCLAALGKGLTIALNKNNETSQDIIKPLSDAGRLLSDYHYKESQSRRYALINTLNKQTKDVIKSTKLDDFLFGSGLSEHLKSSKAISKSGQELRPSTSDYRATHKTTTTGQQSAAARRGPLNLRGTPRVPTAATRANPIRRQPLREQYDKRKTTTQRHRGRRH